MLQKLMLGLIIATLGLTGAATADAVDKLAGKTLIIKGSAPCTSSEKATRKTWRTTQNFPVYVSTGRRLFLFWEGSADSGIGVVSDGRPHSSNTIRHYDGVPQSVPVVVRSIATRDSVSLSYDIDYTAKWPRGTKLVDKTSGGGVVVIGSDGRTCRTTNFLFLRYLQDRNEVLEDYRCEAATLGCSIVDGRRAGG